MSDTSRGAGWWIASDGKWYPPELHPSYRQVPPVPPLGAPAGWGQPQQSWPSQPSAGPSAPGWPGAANAMWVPIVEKPPPSGFDRLVPRTKRARIGFTAACVVVVLVIAGVVVGPFGSKSDADAVVINAVTSAFNDKTAHLNLNETVNVAGHSLTIGGTGSIDFSQNAAQITLNGSIEGQSINESVIYLGGVVYVQVPEIATVVPGKSWVSLETSSLGSGQAQGLTQTGGNPAATLRLLALDGNTVSSLGTSTVDGQSVQGYAVTFNQAALQSELAKANLPSWMSSVVSQLTVNNDSTDVYINSAGDLVRESQSVALSVGKLALSATVAADLSDYGAPVSITAPPADQVIPFSQFLQSVPAGSTTT
jgi:hypothetical protein